MKALRSGQTNSWRHAQWERTTRQETATHKGALCGPGFGLMYPLVTVHPFPPGNTMHPIRVCWCMILHFPWCNLVLWWYQMYLIAENPKCLFWITVYHVPNLDPRSWIRPASAEFCFFWCPFPQCLDTTRFSKNLITTNLSTENHIPGRIHWNWLGFYLYRFTRTFVSPPNAAWPRSFQHTHTAMRQVWLALAGCFAQAVAVEDRWNNSLLGCRWTKLGLVETTYVGLYLQNANSLHPLMSGNYPSINTPEKVLAMSLILSNGHSVPGHSRFSRIYWLLSTTIF